MATHDRLAYYSPRFDACGPQPPRARYAIFSSQRTGSNYLCARLCNIEGRLGMPMEYLHGRAVIDFGQRLLPGRAGPLGLDDYLAAVARVRTTADGWFGIKIQPNQLLPLIGGDVERVAALLAGFDKVVFMRREDKLAQAISCAIARASGVWFNFGEEPALAAADRAPLLAGIRDDVARFAREEALMREVAGRLPPGKSLEWTHEALIRAPHRVFAATLAHLGIAADDVIVETERVRPTERPPGTLAAQLRAAYLERYPPGDAQSTRNG